MTSFPATLADFPQMHVLVADDSEINQKLALTVLEQAGHTTDVVGTGREACNVLRDHEYDLVLMDVQMPDLDGVEATRLIRKREHGTGAHVPIIAVTAHAMDGDRETCLDAGMDDYIPKPMRTGQLAAAVERVVTFSGKQRRAAASHRREPDESRETLGAETPEVADLHAALDRIDGNVKLFHELGNLFLAGSARQMEDVQAAVRGADAKRLRYAAHTLKGSLKYFAADRAVNLAEGLEIMGRNESLEDAPRICEELSDQVGQVQSVVEQYLQTHPEPAE